MNLLQVQIQTFDLEDGATDSLFFELNYRFENSETLLPFLQKITHFDKRKKYYATIIDFLVCELFPKHRKCCKKFYQNEGESLREIITPEEKVSMEATLLLLLDFIEVIQNDHLDISWNQVKLTTPIVVIML